MKIQHQSDNLIVFESALYRTTTTLVIGEDHLLLIDPNWLPIEIDFIKQTVDQFTVGRACYLGFTHSDYDHIIGYEVFKEFITIASQHFVDSPEKDNNLNQILKFDDKHYITRDYPSSYPHIDLAIQSFPHQLKLGSCPYAIHEALGHNHDGIIFWNKKTGVLIVGDYLSNIEFPFIYHSFEAYRKTLTTLSEIINNNDINCLVVGHGDCTFEKSEMQKRLAASKAYLDELDNHVKAGVPFNLDKLKKAHPYPGGTIGFHEQNVKILTKSMK